MTNLETLYQLIQHPEAGLVVYDLCLENNWAIPDTVLPHWLYKNFFQVITPTPILLPTMGQKAISWSGLNFRSRY